ncbi:MAG: homoserine dehydrogenase [Candidatus Methanomethyliaceae archaeon]|nr:homoserine dehydrogenase [Candidatus Methanomethyliaceae archaeon]MDW7970631.1 homoserine dehydrogenase [Nitrososphaerota archaeon]
MQFDIALIGFGTVGRGFVELLIEKKALLKEYYGIEWRITAISDLKLGSIINSKGIDAKEALRLADTGRSLENLSVEKRGLSSLEVIRESSSNLLVEVTWTNLENGEPGYSHVKEALNLGKDVITTNKGPVALYYRELKELAKKRGAFFKFKGTVMSGTPSFNLIEGPLAGCYIESIRGILNGTTNFILSEMERGMSYEEALREAQRLGYAEADPTMDVEGLDAVAKLAILCNVIFDLDLKPKEIPRRGISSITLEDVKESLSKGKRIKLIARAEKIEGKLIAEVKPIKLSLTDPLANIMGVMNAINFKTDCLGEITVIGPGAGRRATGYAILSDMINIAMNRR